MSKNLLMAVTISILFLSSCSNDQACEAGYKKYEVYVYDSSVQRYLFFKEGEVDPIDYNDNDVPDFNLRAKEIFSGTRGRDMGVEAQICGKIENVDYPLSPYSQIVMIRRASIVRAIDLTDRIKGYKKRLGDHIQ